ncbi:MAG TPA: hypothetical protein GX406_01945, partial [Pseudoclavibacter sp.]|nr:hypothetical protein [Pseudoclavibacter sp.]
MIVTNQQDLDAAIKAGEQDIIIDSPAGVWLVLRGNSSAELRENSSAVLWGNSSAVLGGNSRAVLGGNSRAVLRENSSAELWGNSSAVLGGNSSAVLRENSSAVLWGNSRAVLWGNSSAVLWGNSSAELWGNSSAVLRENSRAVTAKYTAVWVYSDRATFTGSGHLIDMTKLDLSDAATWCDYHGVKIARGKAVVYKAVDAQLNAGHRHTLTRYPLGGKVAATDWNPQPECGGGLHFAASPSGARQYYTG